MSQQKGISYSLFGYDRVTPENCFEFETYLRGLWVNLRINRVLYPEWVTVINIDHASVDAEPYTKLHDWISDNMKVEYIIRPDNVPLTRAMLWRAETAFTYVHPNWKYSHVLCRDTDSIGTYREAQAVAEWVKEDRAIHAITDSISHNIPLMGGMIGIRPNYINDRLHVTDKMELMFSKLLAMAPDINYNRKGADQDFLNRVIYPKVQDSLTSHFVLGMRQVVPEGGGMHYSIPDIELFGVDQEHKFLNTCAGHIGASGYYEPPMLKWLNTIDPYKDSYVSIQKQFPRLMFWQQ